jgi:hypothetical protein
VVRKIQNENDLGVLQVAICTQMLLTNTIHDKPLEKCAQQQKKKKKEAPNQTAA